jgi:hypothetical protein
MSLDYSRKIGDNFEHYILRKCGWFLFDYHFYLKKIRYLNFFPDIRWWSISSSSVNKDLIVLYNVCLGSFCNS